MGLLSGSNSVSACFTLYCTVLPWWASPPLTVHITEKRSFFSGRFLINSVFSFPFALRCPFLERKKGTFEQYNIYIGNNKCWPLLLNQSNTIFSLYCTIFFKPESVTSFCLADFRIYFQNLCKDKKCRLKI